MFNNYFTIAVRNFLRNKTFSVINVLGLSIGISAALVMFLIVYYEFSFDKFVPDRDRVYRVVLDAKFSGTEGHSAGLPAPLGSAIENEVTGVEKTVPVFQFQGDGTAKVEVATATPGKPVIYKKQPNVVFTNPQYFSLLGYSWIVGSPQAGMQDPFSVVLTESRAKQYFPGIPVTDVIGKQITYNGVTTTVAGVVKDLNKTTAFTADQFISLATIAKTNLQDNFMMTVWDDWMAYSQLYIKLSEGTNPQATEAQLKVLLNKYNKKANKDANNTMSFHLQPLDDIHFNGLYQSVGGRVANKLTLYGLLAIAAFLLLLGCINFINLTTAQATKRAKEIGIRKTMGSSRKQLVLQFLSETLFITVIATVISVALIPLLLKMFTDFIPPGLHFDLFNQPKLILFLLILTIAVSFLSGLYPALILSGYKPVSVLKGQAFNDSGQTRNAWVRKTLTVSQFVIAQFFIIATLMVSKQINYSMNADLGFKKDAILTFETPRDTVKTHGQKLLHEIQSIPEVEIAASGFLSPADLGVAFTNISYPEKKDIVANVQIRWGDPNYLNVYGIKLLAGRNVKPSDSNKELIINETYAKILGFKKPEEALNKYLNLNSKDLPIVGIMQDFHDQSFRASIGPIAFAGNNGTIYHVRLKPNNANGHVWQSAIAKMEKAYKQMYPEEDFKYSFFDETISKMYQSEQNTARLLKWASGLAIFISCLGLLGLVIYITNTRTKEIGIRKILGASVATIVSILSRDFMRLVILAFLIAAPIAWWASYKWLQDFVYRTPMSWWVFALSGLVMIVLAVITLGIQTIKAAVANPVKSLRTE
ncbi:ABC transporter permease [Segetibacter aerophilus]|uniref:ABC transporter permease n=1 Tax=Segetibacter aerophilus TaxID=670293 RepID=A0A512BB70_9BACT|nr:ABC transporter permease [Segetibacter aerophilus]GEO09208.1 ABC transporter permease [Segetibacter aerophilus]